MRPRRPAPGADRARAAELQLRHGEQGADEPETGEQDAVSWREMSRTVPAGQAPELDPGETWDPVTDRVTTAGGHGSYQVRRPGMCSLCPAPGQLLQLVCAPGEHAWDQLLCGKHEQGCGHGGEVSCLAHREHVDVLVIGSAGPAE